MRNKNQEKMATGVFVSFLLYCAALNIVLAFPSPVDDLRYDTTRYDVDRNYASSGVHQLASWLALQLHPKIHVAPVEISFLPLRLPLQEKRNSEVTNAIIGSEETQKMYRNGRK